MELFQYDEFVSTTDVLPISLYNLTDVFEMTDEDRGLARLCHDLVHLEVALVEDAVGLLRLLIEDIIVLEGHLYVLVYIVGRVRVLLSSLLLLVLSLVGS